MTPLNFAIVGLRLIGIYLILEAGPLIGAGSLLCGAALIAVHAEISASMVAISAIIPAATQFLFGLFLLIFSVPLAKKVCSPVEEKAVSTTLSLSDIQVMAFALVGLLVIAGTIPNLFSALLNIYYWYSEPADSMSRYVAKRSPADLLGSTVKLLLGLYLFMSPQGFLKIWHWMRTAGTGPKE